MRRAEVKGTSMRRSAEVNTQGPTAVGDERPKWPIADGDMVEVLTKGSKNNLVISFEFLSKLILARPKEIEFYPVAGWPAWPQYEATYEENNATEQGRQQGTYE